MPLSDVTLPDDADATLVRAGWRDDEASLTLLHDALANGTTRAKVLAVRGLVRRDAVTTDEWCAALRADALELRREAARLLGYLGVVDDVVAPVLLANLTSDDPLLVEATVFAAGECALAAAFSALRDVVERHDDARCREAAVVALAQIGVDDARSTVIAALGDKPTVRRRAVVALANFEGDDVEAALTRAADDRDWQVRSAVEQLRREDD